jgi:hypothetical protein
MTVRPSLLCALSLILTSCASLRPQAVAYVPPRIDCAAYDAPQVNPPADPGQSRDIAVWQLNAIGWQAYAEHVLGQRVNTALCLQKLASEGVIK